MKKQPPAATASASAATSTSQEKSTEKKSNDNKPKKEQSQTKSNEASKGDQKAKKTEGTASAAAAAAPPKAHFTTGAQGDSEHAYRTLDMLISLFEQAIRKAFPNDSTLPVLVVPGKQTDYQCNSAMPIASVRKCLQMEQER